MPNKPTEVRPDGTRVWKDGAGRYHRTDGPAIEHANGKIYYFWHGQQHSCLTDMPRVGQKKYPEQNYSNSGDLNSCIFVGQFQPNTDYFDIHHPFDRREDILRPICDVYFLEWNRLGGGRPLGAGVRYGSKKFQCGWMDLPSMEKQTPANARSNAFGDIYEAYLPAFNLVKDFLIAQGNKIPNNPYV